MLHANILIPAAAAVVGVNSVAGAYFRRRRPRATFFARLAGFAALTAVLIAAGVVPYADNRHAIPRGLDLLYDALEVVWWLSASWLAVGFLRAFVSFGGRQREAKLVQDLLAGLVYATAAIAVAAEVFHLPVKGLLATSGALAIVIGLALQNSLGDVFSGIVLNIERPYRVGDWIIVDENVQGQVIETNWRATHILTGRQDVAVVPNSVIAKQKIVNCSAPTPNHGASLRIKLEPSISPAAGCELLTGVLLGVGPILNSPPPSVVVKDMSAESIEFELSYSVAGIGQVDAAQNELFDRLYRATSAAGIRFSPRLALPAQAAPPRRPSVETTPERLISGLEVFAPLTPEERQALAAGMVRRAYKAGETVAARGDVLHALDIVAAGVLVLRSEQDGVTREAVRLVAGDYFGERGVLAGAPLSVEAVALTRAVVYELPAEVLAPVLKSHPAVAEQLGENLSVRRLAHSVAAAAVKSEPIDEESLSRRFAAAFGRLLRQ